LERLRSLTRSGEWLTWKIPFFLTAGLVVIHSSGKPLDWHIATQLALVLVGMVIGAVFVSVVNDITDLEDDHRAGKVNRFHGMAALKRNVILSISILALMAFMLIGIQDDLSRLFYLLASLSFVVYSVPPFRMKKKGAWGGLGDAFGASLFPTLFVAAQTGWVLGHEIPMAQIAAISVWSFMHGLRGILWHQHRDRAFDEAIGSRTFTTENRLHTLRVIEPLIVMAEMFAFLFFAGREMILLLLFLLSVHLVVVFLSQVLLDVRHTMVVSSPDREQYMLYGSFYQIFCPTALILSISGWSTVSLFLLILLLLLILPDLRINYYLVKRMVYANREVREILRRRDIRRQRA
jgi:4-hydroxybenzoate polyprenyltransferase